MIFLKNTLLVALPILLLTLTNTACKKKKQAPTTTYVENTISSSYTPDTSDFFPLTNYILGQEQVLTNSNKQPVYKLTINGKTDSVWKSVAAYKEFLKPFLNPVIDSTNQKPYYTASKFLDNTVNSYVFTHHVKTGYEDSLALQHWDVYIPKEKGKIDRVFMLKNFGKDTIIQYTYLPDEAAYIRTFVSSNNEQKLVKEEMLYWGY